MFFFGNRVKKIDELETIIQRIESNMANNYKDNAQDYLKKFESRLNELSEAGKLKENQKNHYESVLEGFKIRMKGFTHKDQKPYWT